MHDFSELLESYTQTRKEVKNQRKKYISDSCDDTLTAFEKKQMRSTLNSDLRNIDFIIKWLEIGKNPDNFREIGMINVYQRTEKIKSNDPHHIQSMVGYTQKFFGDDEESYEDPEMSDYEIQSKLATILYVLTQEEKEILYLRVGKDKSLREIAERVGKSHTAVKEILIKIDKKISDSKKRRRIMDGEDE